MHRRLVARESSRRREEEESAENLPLLSPHSTMTADNKVASTERQTESKQEVNEEEKAAVEKEEDKGLGACCGPVTSLPALSLKLTLCALAGIAFGLALEKGRVFEPKAIRYQMVFEQWTMLKMFLAAMGVGQFVLAVMSVIPHFRPIFSACCLSFFASQEDNGILRSLVGPFILGCGMSVAGACPGMVLAQVGSNTKNALFTLCGGLLGALMFGLVGDFIIRLLKPTNKYSFHTIQDKTGIYYAWIAFPMSVSIIAVCVLLELFIPWHEDLPPESHNPVNGTGNVFTLKSWPPTVAGSIIGLLQVIVSFSVKDTLGSSSAYMTVMSQLIFFKKLKEMLPNFAKYRCGIGNWWQVFYVCFAMVGSFLSSFASQTTGSTPGVNLASALAGGFLMLFGARIGSGCTSGHGLSGTALLFWWSFLAVPAMFAGGIGTAFSMRGFRVLNQYVCPDGTPC